MALSLDQLTADFMLPLTAVLRTQEKQQALKAQWLMQQQQEAMQQRQDEMQRKFQQQEQELAQMKQQYAQLQEMQGAQLLAGGNGQQTSMAPPGLPSGTSMTQ